MSQAKGDYIVCMDTDDFYNPNYISKSIFNLIINDKQVSGSADMLMMARGSPVYRQRCLYLDMLNEATLVFTKGYSLTHKFSDANSNEGKGFLFGSLAYVFETKIDDIMICIAHDSNTISKTIWFEEKYLSSCDMDIYKQHIAVMFPTENNAMAVD
jgi:Glycosyl transferase family 2.